VRGGDERGERKRVDVTREREKGEGREKKG